MAPGATALVAAPGAAHTRVSRAHVVAQFYDPNSMDETYMPVKAADRTWQSVTVAPGRSTLDQSGGEYDINDLKAQAMRLNPVVGYYDPLGLGDVVLFEENKEASLGFVRQAEIKHGRIAMAGFIGYIVHENGIRWPFPLTLADAAKGGDYYSDYAGLGACDVWDKMPFASKLQIVFFIGFLEIWAEQVCVLPPVPASRRRPVPLPPHVCESD